MASRPYASGQSPIAVLLGVLLCVGLWVLLVESINWAIPVLLPISSIQTELLQTLDAKANIKTSVSPISLRVSPWFSVQAEANGLAIQELDTDRKTLLWGVELPNISLNAGLGPLLFYRNEEALGQIKLDEFKLTIQGNKGLDALQALPKQLQEVLGLPEPSDKPLPRFSALHLACNNCAIHMNALNRPLQPRRDLHLSLPMTRLDWQQETASLQFEGNLSDDTNDSSLLTRIATRLTLTPQRIVDGFKELEQSDNKEQQKQALEIVSTAIAKGQIQLTQVQLNPIKAWLEPWLTVEASLPLLETGAVLDEVALSFNSPSFRLYPQQKQPLIALRIQNKQPINLQFTGAHQQANLPAGLLKASTIVNTQADRLTHFKAALQAENDSPFRSITPTLTVDGVLPLQPGAPAELTINLPALKLGSLAPWLEQWQATRPWALQGALSAANIRLTGPLSALNLESGEISLKEASLGLKQNKSLVLSKTAAHLVIQDGELSLPAFSSQLAKGYVSSVGVLQPGKTDGTSSNQGQLTFQQIDLPTLQGHITQVSRVLPGLSADWQGFSITQGILNGQASWKSSLASPQLESHFNAEELSISLDGQALVQGELEGTVAKEQLSITSNSLRLPGASPWQVKARLPLQNPNEEAAIRVKNDVIGLDPLIAHLKQFPRLLPFKEDLQGVNPTGQLSTDFLLKGPIDQLKPYGQIKLNNVSLALPPSMTGRKTITVENTKGTIALDGDTVELDEFSTVILAEGQSIGQVSTKGAFNTETGGYQLAIQSPNLELGNMSPWLAGTGLQDLKGHAVVDIKVEAQNASKAPKVVGQVLVKELTATPDNASDPVSVPELRIAATPEGRLHVQPVTGKFGPVPFRITGTGQLNGPSAYQVTLDIDELPIASLRDNANFYNGFLPQPLPPFWATEGSASVHVAATDEGLKGTIGFNDAGFYIRRSPLPIHGLNGTLMLEGQQITTKEPLRFGWGNGNLMVDNLTIDLPKGANSSTEIDLEASGTLSSLELNTLYGNYFYFQPTQYNLQSEFQSHIQTHLPKGGLTSAGASLNATFATQLSGESPSRSLSTNEPLWLNTEIAYTPKEFTLRKTNVVLPGHREKPLHLDVTVQSPLRLEQRSLDARLYTEAPLELAKLDTQSAQPPIEAGELTVDVAFHSNPQDLINNPELMSQAGPVFENWLVAPLLMAGHIDLNHLQAEPFGIYDLTGGLRLKGNDLTVLVEKMETPGTELSLNLTSHNIQQYPLKFNEGSVSGRSFYVEGTQETLGKLTQSLFAPLASGKPPSLRWINSERVTLPFELHKTDVQLKEVIVNNLILDQFSATLDVFANANLQLKPFDFMLAGGHASGELLASPSQDGRLSMLLDTQAVSANALARSLLNAPNELFGELSGHIAFSTYGTDEVSLIQNANGNAGFYIEKGRLPSIAKIETLLTAANIIRGGVLGFNLGNLVRAVRPFETNYFARLGGDFQIAEGTMFTQNLHSDGENLDLDIKGSIQLDNGVGDLAVVGSMSQDVSGALGHFGKLSLRHALKWLPVVGYIPGQKKGLVDYVPGIGFIPGLGGTPNSVNRFRVQLQGLLEDPSSVKNLTWLD